MYRSLITYCCFLLALVSTAGCVKDKPAPDDTGSGDATAGQRVFIVNEGSLGGGNGSLSVYDKIEKTVHNDIFYQKNGSYLGDVFQSLTPVGDRLYLAINNSSEIVVIQKSDYALIDKISVNKPRYMLPLTDNKMYVSTLFYPEINIVNPQTGSVTGTIPVDYPNTEGLLAFGDKVYACNWDTACTYLYEIDPRSDAITRRIPLNAAAPNQVLADKNGQLWVFSGNVEKGKTAKLTRLDPVSGAIQQSFTFPAGSEIMKPVFNPTKDTFYFLGVNYNNDNHYNGVFRMAITDQQLPQQPLIPAQPLQYFWALGLDPKTGEIYVGDPKGFIQRGSVSIYNPAGERLRSFEVALGPGFFYFE